MLYRVKKVVVKEGTQQLRAMLFFCIEKSVNILKTSKVIDSGENEVSGSSLMRSQFDCANYIQIN